MATIAAWLPWRIDRLEEEISPHQIKLAGKFNGEIGGPVTIDVAGDDRVAARKTVVQLTLMMCEAMRADEAERLITARSGLRIDV